MDDHSPTRPVDRLMILTAALLFSSGGTAVKLTTLTAWQVASLRSGIAAVTLLFLLPSSRRGWSRYTFVVGSAYAATMICYVVSNKLTTAANAVFLQSTAPLYVLLLGPWLLSEPIRGRQLVFMTALFAGILLIFGGGQTAYTTAPDPMRGNLVALGAGVFWALTIVGLRWLGRDRRGHPPTTGAAAAVACGNLVACAVTLPAALPVVGSTAVDWGAVAFLGIFQIALAYVFLVHGVRRVGALEVSLLVLLEPVLGPVWAWIVHGEKPSELALLGGAVIIIATAVYTVRADGA